MTAPFDLRRVGPADLDRLAGADPRLAADGAHRRHVGDLLASDLSWAAVADGVAAGFAVVTRHFYGFPFVDLLVVAESRRRGGIGSALMERCVAAADADRVFTSTNESNAPMRRLLDTSGWRPAGSLLYLDPGDPELVFVKLRRPA
jgi:GNAT superfamily N-acetyltransferase